MLEKINEFLTWTEQYNNDPIVAVVSILVTILTLGTFTALMIRSERRKNDETSNGD